MFRLLSLDIKNVGPFEEAHLDFAAQDAPRVTILTGENGTGKSILLDAIRNCFGLNYFTPQRNIFRNDDHFIKIVFQSKPGSPESSFISIQPGSTSDPIRIQMLPTYIQINPAQHRPPLVLDFWDSKKSSDGYKIQHLSSIEHKNFFLHSLQGSYSNSDAAKLLTHFDYLRTSSIESERLVGERLFELSRRIVEMSLLDGGELVGIRRADFTPILKQAGREVPIENLSSGNAYLLQRMLSLLGKMYSFHVLTETPAEEIGEAPGLLMIDEAENHLHPKWQKRLLRNILELFPNLQIIAATHSPFLVASVPGARIYACKFDRERQVCYVEEQREDVSNRPIDEILLSGIFDETQPFNEEISRLLQRRQEAIAGGDKARREEVEQELLARNPQRFAYFEIGALMTELGLGS